MIPIYFFSCLADNYILQVPHFKKFNVNVSTKLVFTLIQSDFFFQHMENQPNGPIEFPSDCMSLQGSPPPSGPVAPSSSSSSSSSSSTPPSAFLQTAHGPLQISCHKNVSPQDKKQETMRKNSLRAECPEVFMDQRQEQPSVAHVKLTVFFLHDVPLPAFCRPPAKKTTPIRACTRNYIERQQVITTGVCQVSLSGLFLVGGRGLRVK